MDSKKMIVPMGGESRINDTALKTMSEYMSHMTSAMTKLLPGINQLSRGGGSGGAGGIGGMSAMAFSALIKDMQRTEDALKDWGAGIKEAVVGFGDLTKAAAELGNEFSRMKFAGGGTGQQTAQLAGMGSVFGIDLNSRARMLADTLSHSDVGAAFGARSGIYDYGAFDTSPKAPKLLKMIEALRKMPEADAMQAAYAIKQPDLLQYRNLSDKTMGSFKKDAVIQASVFSPDFMKNSAEFSAALSRMQTSFSTFLSAGIRPFLPAMTVLFDNITELMQKMTSWILDHQNQFQGAAMILKGMFEGAFGVVEGDRMKQMAAITDLMQGYKLMRTPSDSQTAAMEALTAAINANTEVIKNGVYGGGERARGAVPGKMFGGWKGQNAEIWGHKVATLGAFAM